MSKSVSMTTINGMFKTLYTNATIYGSSYAQQGVLYGLNWPIYQTPCGSVEISSSATPRTIMTMALKWSDVNDE